MTERTPEWSHPSPKEIILPLLGYEGFYRMTYDLHASTVAVAREMPSDTLESDRLMTDLIQRVGMMLEASKGSPNFFVIRGSEDHPTPIETSETDIANDRVDHTIVTTNIDKNTYNILVTTLEANPDMGLSRIIEQTILA